MKQGYVFPSDTFSCAPSRKGKDTFLSRLCSMRTNYAYGLNLFWEDDIYRKNKTNESK